MPLFLAVAATDLASISATADICPEPGFEPSLFGKFLVVCLIDNPLFAGVSPAPKQGPQKAVFTTAPLSIRSATAPFLVVSINTGCDEGYTFKLNSSKPVLCPLSICAASITFEYVPPAQPAMIPCDTRSFPFSILSTSFKPFPASPPIFIASTSTSCNKSSKFSLRVSIS